LEKGKIRCLAAIPRPQSHARFIAEFAARGEGIVCSRSPSRLKTLESLVPEAEHCEWLELGRVVAKFARLAGEEPVGMAADALKAEILARILNQAQPGNPFYETRGYPGLHRRLVSTLDELEQWGFHPQHLHDLASEVGGRLGAKLTALANLQTELTSELDTLRRETHGRQLERCLASKPSPDVNLPPLLIFLDSEWAPLQIEWINWAVGCGASITVITDSAPDTDSLFREQREMASRLNCPFEHPVEPPSFARSLFAGTQCPKPELHVSTMRAPDPLAEVEWTLRACLELSESTEPSRIGIFARNLTEYAPLVSAASDRLGIQARVPLQASLLSNGFIRTLQALFQALDSDTPVELGELSKSGYWQLDRAASAEVIAHIASSCDDPSAAWRLVAGQIEPDEPWSQWLALAAKWRLENHIAVRRPSEWVEQTKLLIDTLDWNLGSGMTAERDIRARNAFERGLSSFASAALESDRLNWREFLDQIKRIIIHQRYLPPMKANGIQVGDAASEFGEVDYLFVVGMIEGSFPRRRTDDPILHDEERIEINHRRNLIAPLRTSFERARRERDEFYSICSAPAQFIQFSYPEASDERDNVPAFYLFEVQRALGRELDWISYPRRQFAPEMERCRALSDRLIREALDAPKVPTTSIRELGQEMAEQFAMLANDAVSPREIRSAWECPFRFFVESRLKVFPDRDRRRWFQLRQVPASAELSRQPDAVHARAAVEALVGAELDRMKSRVEDWEFQLLSHGALRLVEDWLDREFRAREIWPKDPDSVHAQVKFGSADLRGDLPKIGSVRGETAGVSRMGKYKVVHMAESNTPSIERGNPFGLKDRDLLYFGTHLLAAFEPGSIPALEVESISGGRKLIVMRRDPDVELVADVEHGLEVIDLSGQAQGDSVQEVFFRRLKDLLQVASETIRKGKISPTPGDHCQFCDYGELCRQSALFSEEDLSFEADDA
jgi:hypothetical protein